MAEFGFNIPCSRKPPDIIRSIFDIVSQYCFSTADMEEFNTYPERIQDLSLQTFSNSQIVMLHTKLLQYAKDYFRKYFPNDSVLPKASLGMKHGLSWGQTILDRFYNKY
jgi:hypothetical protein